MLKNESVYLALNWLANSNIRQSKGEPISRGGIKQGYNWQSQSYPFIYSEITGYGISAFVNAYLWTTDDRYLTLAHQAAKFLLGVQNLVEDETNHGAIPHSLSIPNLTPNHQYYSFDAAMCLQGLLDLNAIEPSKELVNAALSIGQWLVNRMQLRSGAFLAMYDLSTDNDRHKEDLFGDNGCLHAKNAIGLFKLSLVTNDERYAIAAKQVCDWVLKLQGKSGAFRTTETNQQVLSHTHSYATEGLLFAYYITKIDRYLEAAQRAGQWLLLAQNRDGSLNLAYRQQWFTMGKRIIEKLFPHRVTDATSQAIRIWLSLYYLDRDKKFLEACQKAKGFLSKMQCTSTDDTDALGGFYFWPHHPIMFTWATMFAMNAVYQMEQVENPDGYARMMKELF